MAASVSDQLLEECSLEVRIEMQRLRNIHGSLAMALTLATTELLVTESRVGPWDTTPPENAEVDARSEEFLQSAEQLLADDQGRTIGRVVEGH